MFGVPHRPVDIHEDIYDAITLRTFVTPGTDIIGNHRISRGAEHAYLSSGPALTIHAHLDAPITVQTSPRGIQISAQVLNRNINPVTAHDLSESVDTRDVSAAVPTVDILPSWALEPGMHGMYGAVKRLKLLARDLQPQAEFTKPRVRRFYTDEGDEVAFISMTVRVPEEADYEGFFDAFYGRLADLMPPGDLRRLAVGIGFLGPRS